MVFFSLRSSTLVLAAFCFLVTAVSSYRNIICNDNKGAVQRLSCDGGVIKVQAALFGREDREICSQGRPTEQLVNTECSQQGTLEAVRKLCDGKKVCELNVQTIRTTDPCVGTFKYLETKYDCYSAFHQIICEHSMTTLHCDVGQVIQVYGAEFGRRDSTICFYERIPSQVENVYCSNPTSKIAESCNGKNSCDIEASSSVFGDPCFGTYKYLEVAYTCQYPL